MARLLLEQAALVPLSGAVPGARVSAVGTLVAPVAAPSVVNPAAHMGIGLSSSAEEDDDDIRGGELVKTWGLDPVHPTEAAYSMLAETLLEKAADLTTAANKTANSCLTAPPGAKKRKRSPSVDRRPSWIKESITEVGRKANYTGRGGHHGRRLDAPGPSTSYGHSGTSGGYRGARGGRGQRGRLFPAKNPAQKRVLPLKLLGRAGGGGDAILLPHHHLLTVGVLRHHSSRQDGVLLG